VANYYAGSVALIDPATGRRQGDISLGPQPDPDLVRRGEIIFHDAVYCFQQWNSCASCHPDGRVDGLPWDFMRDGIGNGKDVISLVLMPGTSPHNRRATRPDPRTCMRTGVTGSHLVVPQAREVADLLAYAEALEPEPNPAAPQPAEAGKGDKSHLCEAPSGPLRGKLDLSPFPAGRGKTLFEGKAGCAVCHPAPHFTDRKMHDVGLHSPGEPDGRYDTPSLVEAYRTAPYYHDGRAVTIQEALTTHNPEDKHGQTQALTPQEIEDLAAYVLSL